MQSELRLPKNAAERTHRGKIWAEKKTAFASGRRAPVGLRLPKCAADWTYRGKIRREKKTAFAAEGGRRSGYACRRARRRSLTGVLRQLPGWHFCVYSLRPAAAQSEQSPCSRSAQSSHSMAPHTGQPRKERASAARWHMAHSIIDIQNTPSQRLRRRGWPGRFPGRLH